jgi:AcrR family transcriptional regulator
MSSQKSTGSAGTARLPVRQRGKLRVAALLDAGTAVFASKGYEAATMTEIAAQAKAAIGSLYQFFPSKEALADALIARYGELLDQALAAILARAAGLSPADVADALVELMMDLRTERAGVIALLDARGDNAPERHILRDAMRGQIAEILRTAMPSLADSRAMAMASMILQILKSIPALAEEDSTSGTDLVSEARDMIRLYVTQGASADPGR